MSKSEFFEYDTVLNVLADHSEGATDEVDKALLGVWDDLKAKVVTGELVMPEDNTPHATLPVGRIIYQQDGQRVYASVIRKVIYDTFGPAFDDSAIGESIFLTREAAEAALAASQTKGGAGA